MNQRIDDKLLVEQKLERQLSKLQEQLEKQQEDNRRKEEEQRAEISKLNQEWEDRLLQSQERTRKDTLMEAETRFDKSQEESKNLILAMQERLESLAKSLNNERDERLRLENRVKQHDVQTEDLTRSVQNLSQENQEMKLILDTKNAEIEQLRTELSQSRGGTPIYEPPSTFGEPPSYRGQAPKFPSFPGTSSDGISLRPNHPVLPQADTSRRTGPSSFGGAKAMPPGFLRTRDIIRPSDSNEMARSYRSESPSTKSGAKRVGVNRRTQEDLIRSMAMKIKSSESQTRMEA